jgi:hypothetical protein
MAREESDLRTRKNVSLLPSVITTGEALVKALHKSSFSQLLTDLIMEAHNRQASGGTKGPEQYLTQIVDLLEKNRALEAKLKEKMEEFKLDRTTLKEALRLAEADLKQARSSGK